MNHQNLQLMLGNSSAALLAIASILLRLHNDKHILGDLLWDEPIGLNACSDSIDNLLAVWETRQLVLGVSRCSWIVVVHCVRMPLTGATVAEFWVRGSLVGIGFYIFEPTLYNNVALWGPSILVIQWSHVLAI